MPQSWAEPTRPRDPVEPTSEASVPTPGLAQRRQRKEREREAGREEDKDRLNERDWDFTTTGDPVVKTLNLQGRGIPGQATKILHAVRSQKIKLKKKRGKDERKKEGRKETRVGLKQRNWQRG